MLDELKENMKQVELRVELFKQELISKEEKRLTEKYLNKFIVYNVNLGNVNEYAISKVKAVNVDINFNKINSYNSSLEVEIIYPRNVNDTIFSIKDMLVLMSDFKVFDTEEAARLYVEVI